MSAEYVENMCPAERDIFRMLYERDKTINNNEEDEEMLLLREQAITQEELLNGR